MSLEDYLIKRLVEKEDKKSKRLSKTKKSKRCRK